MEWGVLAALVEREGLPRRIVTLPFDLDRERGAGRAEAPQRKYESIVRVRTSPMPSRCHLSEDLRMALGDLQ
jgi:hypothetical protein